MATKTIPSPDKTDAPAILATELGDVLGHGLIKNLLGRMILENRLPQALLFAGPPLVGKRSMAVVLAKRLLSDFEKKFSPSRLPAARRATHPAAPDEPTSTLRGASPSAKSVAPRPGGKETGDDATPSTTPSTPSPDGPRAASLHPPGATKRKSTATRSSKKTTPPPPKDPADADDLFAASGEDLFGADSMPTESDEAPDLFAGLLEADSSAPPSPSPSPPSPPAPSAAEAAPVPVAETSPPRTPVSASRPAVSPAAACDPHSVPVAPSASAPPPPPLTPLEALRCDPVVARRVGRGTHLDFNLIQPEKGSKVVRIEQIRALQDWAWISPSEGRAKVVLIFGADTITEEAANSLLKILEEPPPKLTMILVSDHPHRLLETVRSRCSLFAFHPVAQQEVEDWVAERLGRERARLVAGLSEGRPGLALELAEQETSFVRRPLLGELEVLLKNGFLALPGVAARCLRHAGGLRPALDGLLMLLRDALILAEAGERTERTRESTPAGEAAPPGGSPGDATGEENGTGSERAKGDADFLLGDDLRCALATTFEGIDSEAILRAAEAATAGLDLTRHLFIPSELLVMEVVLADVGAALRRASKKP